MSRQHFACALTGPGHFDELLEATEARSATPDPKSTPLLELPVDDEVSPRIVEIQEETPRKTKGYDASLES